MNPYFLWVHLDVLFATLLIVIVFKCSLIALVVRALVMTSEQSFTVGMSLAQVGEFSFVLLSRASAVWESSQKIIFIATWFDSIKSHSDSYFVSNYHDEYCTLEL